MRCDAACSLASSYRHYPLRLANGCAKTARPRRQATGATRETWRVTKVRGSASLGC